MNVISIIEKKYKGTYLRYLRDEARALEAYFEERGTRPEEVYDILDTFRYIGLSSVAKGLSDEETETILESIMDMIENFRQQQGLPGWEAMTKCEKK